MGASIAHRHSNPTTDCSDQKRKIRKRNKKRQGGREEEKARKTLYSTCLRLSSFLDRVLSKLILPHREKKNRFCFTDWSSIRLPYSFPSQSCIYIFKPHAIPSVSVKQVCARLHWEGHHKHLQKHMDVQLQIMPKEGTVGLNSNGTKGTMVGRIRECPILPRAPTYSPRLGSNQMGVQSCHKPRPSDRVTAPPEGEGTNSRLASPETGEPKISFLCSYHLI